MPSGEDELGRGLAALEFSLGLHGMRVGDYLCRVPALSVGGSAEVYVGEHVETGDLWAIKLAKARCDGMEEIFREEHRIGSRLHHQSILTSSAVGRHADGRPYLVLPLLTGDTLVDVRARFSKPKEAARLMIMIAKAVDFAHSRLVLHCDLKAENILFDAKGEPHVADFGLARRIHGEATHGEAWGGTRGWTAPEQLDEKPLGFESDVFPLGVMLHYLLRGKLPFGRSKSYRRRAGNGPPASPLELCRFGSSLNHDLVAICRKAMQPEREARYRTAGAFADDLERALSCQPLHGETGRARRMAKWVKRHPILSFAVFEFLAIAASTPWMIDGALTEVRGTIRNQNEFSAGAQAGAVHGELRALALQVQAMGADPEIRPLLEHPGIDLPAHTLAKYAPYFDSVNVFTDTGIHRARFPASEVPTRENVQYTVVVLKANDGFEARFANARKPASDVLE